MKIRSLGEALALRWMRSIWCVPCAFCGEQPVQGAALCAVCAVTVEPMLRWQTLAVPTLVGWRYGGPLARWLTGLKFNGGIGSLQPFVWPMLAPAIGRLETDAVLVPIPPVAARLSVRGRHLPDEIARCLGRALGREVDVQLLVRTDDAPPRSVTRRCTPQFAVNEARGRKVWVVDDVVTTGVTLTRAVTALAAAGAEVMGAICLTSAWTGPPPLSPEDASDSPTCGGE